LIRCGLPIDPLKLQALGPIGGDMDKQSGPIGHAAVQRIAGGHAAEFIR
jgi:hypothetical protein